jgi:hypothetical protein
MTVSEKTRRNIIQTLKSEKIKWNGDLDDIEFLSRIFDLESLPSNDPRYNDAKRDIQQHTIYNPGDWPSDWIFDDDRFDLLHCSDNDFLRFLCELINPKVRSNSAEALQLLKFFNESLMNDDYQIVEKTSGFGSKYFEAIGILPETVEALRIMKDKADSLSAKNLQREIVRMENSIEKDPELAIGTAKEFLESICKTILTKRKVAFKTHEDLPKLVHMTIDELQPLGAFESNKKVNDLTRRIIGNMNGLANYIAQLRNLFGTGHGKAPSIISLEPRHAALAVNAAATLALFLYNSYERG